MSDEEKMVKGFTLGESQGSNSHYLWVCVRACVCVCVCVCVCENGEKVVGKLQLSFKLYLWLLKTENWEVIFSRLILYGWRIDVELGWHSLYSHLSLFHHLQFILWYQMTFFSFEIVLLCRPGRPVIQSPPISVSQCWDYRIHHHAWFKWLLLRGFKPCIIYHEASQTSFGMVLGENNWILNTTLTMPQRIWTSPKTKQ
jgi:hypothetical protein